MFVLFTSPYAPEVLRPIGDDEPMDCEAFADGRAMELGMSIDHSIGDVLADCGDLRVVFLEDPDNRTRIYTGQSFYFKSEDF